MLSLASKIEALSFWKAEPVKRAELAKLLDATPEEVDSAVSELSTSLEQRGVRLLTIGDSIALSTHPEMSVVIENLVKEELSKDLGKAGLETLAIVAYRGEVSRAEIDHIRGVNSTFVLRNLAIRGLVERVSDPKDERRFLYRPTVDLLRFLGLSSFEELPEFSELQALIQKANTAQAEPENTESKTNEPSHE